MNKKLLVIAGATATGKTSLGLNLSKKFNGELVSADSRQVYKGMDIGTGKDIPENFKSQLSNLKINNRKISFYANNEVKIWGYDLVDPKEEFNVAGYIDIARNFITDIWNRGKLPILVGGTGFYIKGVLEGVETANVLPDDRLRERLAKKNVGELFDILLKENPEKAKSLNNSDKNNPRRLIRAIEVSQHGEISTNVGAVHGLNTDKMFIWLTAPLKKLDEKIKKRVYMRIDQGIEDEINKLLGHGLGWKDKSLQTLGYLQWKDYFEGTKSKDEVIKDWILAESQYARRQITWFKKSAYDYKFDVSDKDYKENIEDTVRSWLADR